MNRQKINVCKTALEGLYPGYSFPSAKPEFLVDELYSDLEFDCYNEELKLAVDYHDLSHFMCFITDRVYDNNSFLECLDRDYKKAELAEKNGVKLICIPFSSKELDIKDELTTKTIDWVRQHKPNVVVNRVLLQSKI